MAEQRDERGMVITLRDVYDAIKDLTETVHVMATQQTVQANTQKEQGQKQADQEQRIRSIERGYWSLPAVSSLPGLASLLMSMGIFKP